MIQFDHITKKYGHNTYALEDVTAEISDGEFVFLIGPSGAGKTTLLRMLLRDILPSTGTVKVDNTDITSIPSDKIYILRRKIGMVFQDFKLLSDRTVYENIAIGLEILGKKDHEIDKGVSEIMDLVSLSKKRNLFPVQLSAGEMQRVSIARAIVGGPKILLADEPTGNLDPKTAWEILEILKQVNEIGTTVIMATHNAGIVNDMKKRTIALVHGKLISDEAKGKYHVNETKHGKKEHGNS